MKRKYTVTFTFAGDRLTAGRVESALNYSLHHDGKFVENVTLRSIGLDTSKSTPKQRRKRRKS